MGMREFKYGVGVIAPNFLLNLLLVKMSKKSSTKADFRGKNKKDPSDNGIVESIIVENSIIVDNLPSTKDFYLIKIQYSRNSKIVEGFFGKVA